MTDIQLPDDGGNPAAITPCAAKHHPVGAGGNLCGEDIVARIATAFENEFQKAASRIDARTTIESLQFDSLDRVRFLFAIEEEFGLEFPDEAFDLFPTIAHFASAIDHYLAFRMIVPLP